MNWRTWQYRRELREIEELKRDAFERDGLTDNQAARCVEQLAAQLSTGRFDLSGIEEAELDSLAAILQGEIYQRRLREGRPLNHV